MSKAIILLSGGLDSTTVLALAKEQEFDCYALSFDYGQKHKYEIEKAKDLIYFLKEKQLWQEQLDKKDS